MFFLLWCMPTHIALWYLYPLIFIIIIYDICLECKVWRNPLNLFRGAEYQRYSLATTKEPLTYYDMNLSAQDHQTFFNCDCDVGKPDYESQFKLFLSLLNFIHIKWRSTGSQDCSHVYEFLSGGLTFASFMHSEYFYNAFSRPLLLRGTPNWSNWYCVEVNMPISEALQATVSEGLAQGPYVAAGVEFKPVTLRTKGTESTNEPPCPTCLNVSRHEECYNE